MGGGMGVTKCTFVDGSERKGSDKVYTCGRGKGSDNGHTCKNIDKYRLSLFIN